MTSIITTGRKWSAASEALAKKTAARLNIACIERENKSIEALQQEYLAHEVLVAKDGQLTLITAGGELFFHPNMAHLRIKNIRSGAGDRMVEAMDLQPGMSVLDCTLGFGADTIVASFVTGDTGKITGVESRPLIEAVVGYGLANFTGDSERIIKAMRRINTVCADALEFLKKQADNSYDIVYFDPMFRHPFLASKSLDPLRAVADKRALTLETIAEAKRVAKLKVVMKETSRSLEFERLGFSKVTGGKYSKVHYGIIELKRETLDV